MLRIAEKYLMKSMEHETDSDKIKVLRDKLFKLRAEIQRNTKKRKMMKSCLDKKWQDDIQKIQESDNIDEKINDLNQRVNIDKNDRNSDKEIYLDDDNIIPDRTGKDKGDEKVFETTKSEASDSFHDVEDKPSKPIKTNEVPLIKQLKDSK